VVKHNVSDGENLNNMSTEDVATKIEDIGTNESKLFSGPSEPHFDFEAQSNLVFFTFLV